MTYKREALSFIVYFGLFFGCGENGEPLTRETARLTTNSDPNPVISFTQNALAVGLNRANEPPSAATCAPLGTGDLAYGTWLADFDGDGLLDVYDVNHGQTCHHSGLWLNNGAGSFGQNLYSVAIAPAHNDSVITGLSNEMQLVADFNGDGKVDMYLLGWSGRGALCINQGTAAHADWSGPSFVCYQAWAAKNFADVNGDGRIDVEIVDPSVPYDPYKDDCRTLPLSWRLNNGNPDPNTWPSDSNDFHFVGLAAPGALIDFNNDGLPDTIHGIEATPDQRGPYLIQSAGLQVSLGQPDGTYRPVTSGLEGVLQPAVAFTDIDEDGCIDVGTDQTGYRDNQTWYVQDRSGTACLATFHPVARTALPYDPGFRHYTVDVDNDGLLDRVVIAHIGYGSDGLAGGIHVFRRRPSGGYQDLGAAGTNINGTNVTEFYADQLSIDDWNGDGKIDIAGAGQASIPGTDEGIALWTSNLTTTNNWLKVRTPDITGFFAGAATIELFDAGFSGDTSHYVTPPKVLRTGQAWAGKLYHFGVGTRATVDLRVTLPNGSQISRSAVETNRTIVVAAAADAGAATSPPVPAAPPTFVQGSFATPQTPHATVTVTYPQAQPAGDLNVVIVGWGDAVAHVTSVADTNGNAYALAAGPATTGNVVSQSIYYAKNIGGAAAGNLVTVTFSQAAVFPDIRILEYRGVDTAAPLDGAASATGSTSSSASGTVTTTSATDLLVGANTVWTSTIGAGAGFSSRAITTPDGDIDEDRVVTAPGPYTAAAPLSGAGPWVMQMVAFRAAPATATSPPP